MLGRHREHPDRTDLDRVAHVDPGHVREPLAAQQGRGGVWRDDDGLVGEPRERRQVEVVVVTVRDQDRIERRQRLRRAVQVAAQVGDPASEDGIDEDPRVVELDQHASMAQPADAMGSGHGRGRLGRCGPGRAGSRDQDGASSRIRAFSRPNSSSLSTPSACSSASRPSRSSRASSAETAERERPRCGPDAWERGRLAGLAVRELSRGLASQRLEPDDRHAAIRIVTVTQLRAAGVGAQTSSSSTTAANASQRAVVRATPARATAAARRRDDQSRRATCRSAPTTPTNMIDAIARPSCSVAIHQASCTAGR